MAKYRKRPVVIEAVRWTGTNDREVLGLTGKDASFTGREHALTIATLEGVMRASVGDWIIRGVKGEVYPCKDDIFQATYESVEPEQV